MCVCAKNRVKNRKSRLDAFSRFRGISDKVRVEKLLSKWALRWNIVEKLFITFSSISIIDCAAKFPRWILLARGPNIPQFNYFWWISSIKTTLTNFAFSRGCNLMLNKRVCSYLCIYRDSYCHLPAGSVTSGCSRVMHYCRFTWTYVELYSYWNADVTV